MRGHASFVSSLSFLAVCNLVLYTSFVVVVVLFTQLDNDEDEPQPDELSCQLSDPPFWTDRRIITVVYKVVADLIKVSTTVTGID
jgi:hypothetical protein